MSATSTIVPPGVSVCRIGALILAIMLPNRAAAEVTIHLASSAASNTSESSYVIVEGLPAETLAALTEAPLDRDAWQRLLTLHVIHDGKRTALPVLGDYSVDGKRLTFTPLFPLKPGLTFRAVFDAAAMPGNPPRGPRVEALLLVPALPQGRPTVVDAIFPSSDVLPENLLKFYVHFSAPMSRGDVYRHIRLLDASGATVDAPFLELAEELWDDTGQRLTLLLDPGRVKQDLKPHEEVGRALAQGNTYMLLIANTWHDADGAPLEREFRKSFRVTKADTEQPDPQHWRLKLPGAGTRQPLVVRFNEPLDHALLQHAIRVSNAARGFLEGSISVSQQESAWSFQPAKPWIPGAHELLVDATLEDRAGNSIGRPFEVYLPAGRPVGVDQCSVPFTIGDEPTELAAPSPSPPVR